MSRRYESIEIMKKKASMSQRVVSEKDAEYAYYAGGSFEIASRMAKIDTMLKHGVVPKELEPLLKLYRSYLDQQRKAFFACVSTEITKLGFILGLKDATIKAT